MRLRRTHTTPLRHSPTATTTGTASMQGHSDTVKAAVITGICAVLVAVIGGVAGWLQYQGPGSASEVATPTKAASVSRSSISDFSIQYPPPEGTELVPQCITARGTGSVTNGQALVVAARENGDSRLYFESVSWNHERDRWSAELNLGDRSSVGHEFTIFAVVLDLELATYLVSTGPYTGWSSSTMPPGSYEASQVKARRSNGKSCSSE